MNNKRLAIIGIIVLLIGIFVTLRFSSSKEGNGESKTPVDIKQMVLDYSLGNSTDESASITSHQLIVTDQENNKTVYTLPENEFFISIAPFINQTHPCEIHSLTGCRGELANEEFQVVIEDGDGNVIIDKIMETYANGFIDLWLPRNQTYNITITQGERIAIGEISTFKDDPTCVTTFQLL